MRKTLILAIALFVAWPAFAQAPTPIVITDKNGNTLSVTGATSGSQVGAPTPAVLTDKNGNALVLGTGSASGAPVGTFVISNTSCGGATNCLQWTDDDTTDNCGAATTTFMALVNAYAGPGIPQVFITGSGTGKAYKFSTTNCKLAFLIPTTIHLWATLDATQTGTNMIQLGPTGLGALSAAQTPKYTVDGAGTLVGGLSLTVAGIECEPFISNCVIDGLSFTNFGAGNATLGNCTNYAVQFDQNVAEGTVSKTEWAISDSTAGRCAYGNPLGASSGQNTVSFVSNVFGGQNGATCSSVGINDGGSYGKMIDNNIFGFGMDVRITGIGHDIQGNQFDSSGCVATAINAAIHYGATGSSAVVGTMNISNNIGQFGGGHLTYLISKAGDSSAALTGVVLVANQAPQVLSLTTGHLIPGASCTGNATTFTNCYIYGNIALDIPATPCGGTFVGWQVGEMLASCTNLAQVANLGSTLLFTPRVIQGTLVTCTVTLTTAATTSSTLPQCVASWTDFRTATVQTMTFTPAWTSSGVGCSGTVTNTIGNSCQGSALILPTNATNVNYSTTGYVSTGATAMQYTAYVNADLVAQP